MNHQIKNKLISCMISSSMFLLIIGSMVLWMLEVYGIF